MPLAMTVRARVAWAMLIVCSIPFILNLLGLDFASQKTPLDAQKVVDGSVKADDLFYAVAGALHHALLEWTAVSISVVAALASFLHYSIRRDVTVPIIGIALLCAGLVDAFHTLAAMRIIQANAPNTDFIPFTWALSRIFNASIMIVGASISLWIARQKLSELNDLSQSSGQSGQSGQSHYGLKTLSLISLVYFFVAYAVVHAAAVSNNLPQTMYPNALITRPFDVLPLALFLFGGTLFWIWYKQEASVVKFALMLSILPEVSTQLHMAFGSVKLFDNHFNIAHFLKILAYSSVLLGILIDLLNYIPKQAAQSNQQHGAAGSLLRLNQSLNLQTVGNAKRPIAIQLPAAAFVLALLVAAIVGSTFYSESGRLLRDQEVEKLRLESTLVEPLLAELYHQSSADVSFLSNTPPIRALITAINDHNETDQYLWRDRLEQIFEQIMKAKPIYLKIRYIGVKDNGKELVNVVRNLSGVQRTPKSLMKATSHTEFFKSSILQPPGDLHFSAVQLSRQKNQQGNFAPVIQVSTPIYDQRSGDIFGIVMINIDLINFISNLDRNALSNFTFYLAAEDGTLIYHSQNHPQEATHLNSFIQEVFPALTSVLTNKQKSVPLKKLANSRGEKHPSFYRFISLQQYGSSHPLHLLLQNTDTHINAQLTSFRDRSLLLGGSMALLALGLAVVASRRLSHPLVTMTSAMQHYERSGEIGELPLTSQDEIGVLARSFNNLLLRMDDALHNEKETSLHSQSIVDTAVDSIITIDKKGVILSFNRAAETMFGYEPTEVINHNISMLMPANDAQKHDGYLKNYSHTGISKIIGVGRELLGQHKDGHHFHMHLAISEVLSTSGIIYTGIIRDISARKAAEQEQSRSLALLEATLESTDNGILVTDSSGIILNTNHKYVELWDTPSDLLNNEDESERVKIISEKLMEPQAFIDRIEYLNSDTGPGVMDTLHFKDGRIFERFSKPMLMNGKTSGRVWSFRDVTADKQYEHKLRQAKEEAEAGALAKSEFLASMSHEIRTPMNGVLGMLGLLKKSELNQDQSHYAKLALSSAESLLTLINDILDFSKVEAGKLELEELEFDIRSQLGDFAESIGHRVQEKGLEIILDMKGILHTMVKGDPGRIRQILTNLVGNAIKFTHQGEIIVRASLENITPQQVRLTCSVSDTGIGIPQDKLGTLFDSFTQVDASTTRKYGGTGLGLAISKQLIELMGGAIHASSNMGQGSCFEFTLLLQSSDKSQAVLPSVDINGVNILVVDDNATNRQVLREQFEQWGARVEEAQSGEHALEIMEQQLLDKEFKVAFLDMQMPGMDGATLGKAIRANERFNGTRLVMMTSMNSRGDARYFAELGFSAYFPKPATTSDLFDALNVVIAGGEALDAASPLVTRHYLRSINPEHPLSPESQTDEGPLSWPAATRLLLVEDNHINQMVAQGVLEDMGLQADVANNGLEALAALESAPLNHPYTLVLMDCQMPEMDGYETTRQIRQGKGGDRYLQLNIIAMTANAMKGDREKCLMAGMNDYLSKPINTSMLQEKLQLWLNPDAKLAPTEAPRQDAKPSQQDIIWDQEDALQRMRGNHKSLKMLASLFLQDMPKILNDLEQAIDTRSYDNVKSVAHTIKGVAANVSGHSLSTLAAQIEVASDQCDEQSLLSLMPLLKQTFTTLENCLSEYLQG